MNSISNKTQILTKHPDLVLPKLDQYYTLQNPQNIVLKPRPEEVYVSDLDINQYVNIKYRNLHNRFSEVIDLLQTLRSNPAAIKEVSQDFINEHRAFIGAQRKLVKTRSLSQLARNRSSSQLDNNKKDTTHSQTSLSNYYPKGNTKVQIQNQLQTPVTSTPLKEFVMNYFETPSYKELKIKSPRRAQVESLYGSTKYFNNYYHQKDPLTTYSTSQTKTKEEVYQLEHNYNKNMAKATEKNSELEDRNNYTISLKDFDLKRKPNLNLNYNTLFEPLIQNIKDLCQAINFLLFDQTEINQLYKNIDVNKDNNLTIDEIYRYFITTTLKTNDKHLQRKFRAIIKIGVNHIDLNNDKKINREEFSRLWKYLTLWDKLFVKFKQFSGKEFLELSEPEFANYCMSIGLKDKESITYIFKSLDTDVSEKISLFEFAYGFTSYIMESKLI